MKRILLTTITAAALISCSPVHSAYKSEHRSVKSDYSRLDKSIATQLSKYEKLKSSSDWDFLEPYAKKENWDKSFLAIKEKSTKNKNEYIRGVKSKKESATETKAHIAAHKGISGGLINESLLINKRASNLVRYAKNKDSVLSQLELSLIDVDKRDRSFNSYADSQASKHENKADKIKVMKQVASGNVSSIKENSLRVVSEFEKTLPKYDEIANNISAINKEIKAYKEYTDEQTEELSSLDKDYTLVLKDMKIEYQASVGMSDWSNYYDCCTEDSSFGAKKISQGDYEYLRSINGDNIADVNDGNFRPRIKKDVWDRIKPPKSSVRLNGGDGNFWLNDLSPTYYHKYTEIEGSNVSDGQWEEVDEEDYALHLNDFGMAIESKPYGVFESEATTVPTPVGLNNVGNKKYGEWRNDSSGNSFWHYYGQYAFFSNILGYNNSYSRNEYDRYNRRDRSGGYYGNGAYGSTGTSTTRSPAYQKSPLGRSGGVKAAPQSLRNKSRSIRARGPRSSGK